MTSPAIVLRFQLTSQLHADALRQWARKTTGTPRWLRTCFVWAGLSLFLWFVLSRTPLGGGRLETLAASAGIMSLILAGGAFRAWLKKGDPVTPSSIDLRCSDLGFEKRTDECESRAEWTAFKSFLETEGFFFLVPQTGLVEALPKSALSSPEDLDALRQLLGRHLSPPPLQGHPVLGRTRPAFYIALAVVLGLILVQGYRVVHPDVPTLSVEEYRRLQADVIEVWISRGGDVEAKLSRPFTREGAQKWRIRVDIPKARIGDPELLDELTQGLPHSAIHDDRLR